MLITEQIIQYKSEKKVFESFFLSFVTNKLGVFFVIKKSTFYFKYIKGI